jgi:hypothetical protein
MRQPQLLKAVSFDRGNCIGNTKHDEYKHNEFVLHLGFI